MVDPTVLPAFVAMILLFLAPPGPDMAYVLAVGLAQGRWGAVRAILGIGTGMAAYATLVALGLGRVAEQWPLALTTVKLGGAAYLLWLARRTWRGAGEGHASATPTRGATYVRGLLVSLANPKLILFFVAVLPQFLGRATSAPAQLAMLGAVNVLSEVVLYGTLGVLAGSLRARVGAEGRVSVLLARLAAAVYAVLALVIITETAF